MTGVATAPAALPAARGSLSERLVARRWPVSAVVFATVVIVWELAARAGMFPDYILGPSRIVRALVDLAREGTLWSATRASLQRSVFGFVVGSGAGVLLGLVAGVSRRLEDFTDPPVGLTYPLPKIALFPAMAVLLGINDKTRVLIIALACFYPCYVNAHSGTRAIDPRFVWVGRNVGASKIRTFFQVILPAALPRVLVGIRISLALSFVVLFSVETIAPGDGLGSLIFKSYLNVDYPAMYGAIAGLALLGFAADVLLGVVGRRLTRGQSIEAAGRG